MQDYTFLLFKAIQNIDFRRAQLDIYIRLDIQNTDWIYPIPSFNLAILKNSLPRQDFENFDVFIWQFGIAQIHLTPRMTCFNIWNDKF